MGPVRRVDLNADIGEAADAAGRRVELGLLQVVSTVHVACGGHAGDDESMRSIMTAARAAGVSVGAHPSYPDRPGFGRRPMAISPDDLMATLSDQLGACLAMARECGVVVSSVKAHGSLYAEVGRGRKTCETLLDAVRRVCPLRTAVVLAAGARAVGEAKDAGFLVLEEGFCDRAYTPGGGLVDRSEPGAVYDDPDRAAAQALSMVGRVDTLCLHGDSPGALAMAVSVRDALALAGIEVASPMAPS
jgi:UPF0271 protein